MRAANAATQNNWTARFDELSVRRSALSAAELDELGLAAWFIGREADSEQAWNDAHRAYLDLDEPDAAMSCAFWLGFTLSEHGQDVKAAAWMSRLFELCAVHPSRRSDMLASISESYVAYKSGRLDDSVDRNERAIALAREAGEPDLEVLATMGLGRSLVQSGHLGEGFACMDRIMLAISSGHVSDRIAGPAYCAVIASCLERWDVERARVWTRDLSAWCDAQHGLEPFRGECSVNRARVLRLGGEWVEAEVTLVEVCGHEQRVETLENAYYWLGELHRLAGHSADADAAYRRAAELGREVQPGLALLRRDAGNRGAARAGVARALESSPSPGTRAELLAVQIDLESDHGDIEVARRAAAELRELSDTLGTDYLGALADRANALVLIETGAADRALPLLRASWSTWRRLDAPYEAAITRMHLGRASRALGDEDAAQLEYDAARSVLAGLRAAPDLTRLERLAALPDAAQAGSGLSRRELEVLQLIARGRSNRQIAHDLFLSERTVARHVSNILTKLGLANRTAATNFAFEHGLVAAS
jgi:ATP/maltotriose-dependent transcriptional regulator MalT